MTKKLCEVDDCLRDGGVIWTFDRPSQPGSSVKAFCYRQGRQFAVSGADGILPLLLQLQDIGLALGLQTVPERADSPRVIKWRGGRSQREAAVALSRAQSAARKERPAQPRYRGEEGLSAMVGLARSLPFHSVGCLETPNSATPAPCSTKGKRCW